MIVRKKSSSGFALLLAIVMVGIVVSVGITVLDVTIKQLSLSTDARNSENAFHATNAGVECALYWRTQFATNLVAGSPISINCFGVNIGTVTPTVVAVSPSTGNNAYRYQFSANWPPSSPDRCSLVTMLVIVSSDTSSPSVASMNTQVPGYPYGTSKVCPPGGVCTVLSAQGYSRPCSGLTPPSTVGTLQREILLEL